MSNAYEAGRPQPQTTAQSSGPFLQLSQAGRAPQYSASNALGTILTQPLVARPGYASQYRINHVLSGGALTGATIAADAPWNVPGQIFFKDGFGTPIFTGDGYSISYLVNLLSGGFGVLNGTNNPANLPSYSALTTAGNGGFSYSLPLEFSQAMGLLPIANASILPTLQFNFSSLAQIFGAATGTAPTIQTTVDVDFQWIPESSGSQSVADVTPPGLGTTRQWQVVQANPTVAASSSARVQLPRLGGYLDTIALLMRDSTGARTDGFWPTRPQLIVDGVPLIDSTLGGVYDDMQIQFGFNTGLNALRPTGLMAFSRKTSLNQVNLGKLDTSERLLSTNPGTLIEFNFAPAGAGSNSPATLSVLVGQIIPSGNIIYGLPEA